MKKKLSIYTVILGLLLFNLRCSLKNKNCQKNKKGEIIYCKNNDCTTYKFKKAIEEKKTFDPNQNNISISNVGNQQFFYQNNYTMINNSARNNPYIYNNPNWVNNCQGYSHDNGNNYPIIQKKSVYINSNLYTNKLSNIVWYLFDKDKKKFKLANNYGKIAILRMDDNYGDKYITFINNLFSIFGFNSNIIKHKKNLYISKDSKFFELQNSITKKQWCQIFESVEEFTGIPIELFNFLKVKQIRYILNSVNISDYKNQILIDIIKPIFHKRNIPHPTQINKYNQLIATGVRNALNNENYLKNVCSCDLLKHILKYEIFRSDFNCKTILSLNLKNTVCLKNDYKDHSIYKEYKKFYKKDDLKLNIEYLTKDQKRALYYFLRLLNYSRLVIENSYLNNFDHFFYHDLLHGIKFSHDLKNFINLDIKNFLIPLSYSMRFENFRIHNKLGSAMAGLEIRMFHSHNFKPKQIFENKAILQKLRDIGSCIKNLHLFYLKKDSKIYLMDFLKIIKKYENYKSNIYKEALCKFYINTYFSKDYICKDIKRMITNYISMDLVYFKLFFFNI